MNFELQEKENMIFFGKGSYRENDKFFNSRLFISNQRIAFLQPVFTKNLLAGLIVFAVAVAICMAICAVMIGMNKPVWIAPASGIIAGIAASKMRSLCGNPERYPLIKAIPESDIRKVECETAKMQYPKFKLHLEDGNIFEFESNNACKIKMQEYFRNRFSVIKK